MITECGAPLNGLAGVLATVSMCASWTDSSYYLTHFLLFTLLLSVVRGELYTQLCAGSSQCNIIDFLSETIANVLDVSEPRYTSVVPPVLTLDVTETSYRHKLSCGAQLGLSHVQILGKSHGIICRGEREPLPELKR